MEEKEHIIKALQASRGFGSSVFFMPFSYSSHIPIMDCCSIGIVDNCTLVYFSSVFYFKARVLIFYKLICHLKRVTEALNYQTKTFLLFSDRTLT